ncbi:DUF305 domain-containing protein [Amycolatopsis cihanbeyliensis]|uniref:Uncharacterized protein (DUF305 family) n=1 Tax=Amycolatopsis cihanbeyliensis TaxID=1128664 RepID=A0A542DRL7_AMYCI|nr:DUF305 domain-containing protein [Amycolatopsis cihanbeyliensis]TQJ05646.1 uncharacterized protein (DUF305 family) [Amycolatopsis cihanbeyliensis]
MATEPTGSTGAAEPAEQPEGTPEPAQATWSKAVIFGAAALAVLLVGATIGLLIGRSTGEEQAAPPASGSVEVGFAQDMSVHHIQAVTMSNWVRDHSTDERIRQLAFDIGSTQLEQIGRMKGWLMLWGQPEQPLGEHMTWMPRHGMHGEHGGAGGRQDTGGHEADPASTTGGEPPMPGMATNAELAKMRSLSGEELDVYFLQLMLRHHEGGTEMAQYTLDNTDLPAVRALTRSMLESQGNEIDLMTNLLAERDADPLPFP